MIVNTLEEVKKGMQSELDIAVINELKAGDYILQNMSFSPMGYPILGGPEWIASYKAVKYESNTGLRATNGKYTDTIEKTEIKNSEIRTFGGEFSFSLSLRDDKEIVDETEYQMRKFIKDIKKDFLYQLINGSSENEKIEGLDVLLKNKSTDMMAPGDRGLDLSSGEKIEENTLLFVSIVNEWLALLDRKPAVILGNSILIDKIKKVSKIAGLNDKIILPSGKPMLAYEGIPLIALDDEIILNDPVNYTTSLFAVSLGNDALSMAYPSNSQIVEVKAPILDEETQRATGFIKFKVTPVLVNTKSCGVLRNIKVK